MKKNTTTTTAPVTETEKAPKITLASLIRSELKSLRKDRSITVVAMLEKIKAKATEAGLEAEVNYRAVFRALKGNALPVEGAKGTFKRKDAAENVSVPKKPVKAEKAGNKPKKDNAEVPENTAEGTNTAPENTPAELVTA